MTDLYFPGYIAELRAAQTAKSSSATAAAPPGGVATPSLPVAVADESSQEQAA